MSLTLDITETEDGWVGLPKAGVPMRNKIRCDRLWNRSEDGDLLDITIKLSAHPPTSWQMTHNYLLNPADDYGTNSPPFQYNGSGFKFQLSIS